MGRKTRKGDEVAPAAGKKPRLCAPVTEALKRKAGSYAKAHGITIGDLVTAALEAHMRHWYWVDRRAESTPGGPARPDVGPPALAVVDGQDAA